MFYICRCKMYLMEWKSNNWDIFSMLQSIIVSLWGLGISKINAIYCMWIKYSLILERERKGEKKKMDRLRVFLFLFLFSSVKNCVSFSSQSHILVTVPVFKPHLLWWWHDVLLDISLAVSRGLCICTALVSTVSALSSNTPVHYRIPTFE